MRRKQDPASDTSDSLPIHTAFHTLRKRPQRQPSDDGRAHLAQTIDNARVRILTDMFCQKPRAKTPRFRTSHKKTALAATTRRAREKALEKPFTAVLRK